MKVDQVKVASGATAVREIVVHPGAVAVVPLLPYGQVVLIRQYRHAAEKVLWELPAGTRHPGEDPAACARRELIEEVGYEAGRLEHLFSAYLTPGYSSEIFHFYLATELHAVPRAPDGDEDVVPVILPLAEAVAMVERGEVQNAAAICGLLAAARQIP